MGALDGSYSGVKCDRSSPYILHRHWWIDKWKIAYVSVHDMI